MLSHCLLTVFWPSAWHHQVLACVMLSVVGCQASCGVERWRVFILIWSCLSQIAPSLSPAARSERPACGGLLDTGLRGLRRLGAGGAAATGTAPFPHGPAGHGAQGALLPLCGVPLGHLHHHPALPGAGFLSGVLELPGSAGQHGSQPPLLMPLPVQALRCWPDPAGYIMTPLFSCGTALRPGAGLALLWTCLPLPSVLPACMPAPSAGLAAHAHSAHG